MTAPEFPAHTDPRLVAVVDWSRQIHGVDSDRHDWCIRAAIALIDDSPLPAAGPGTAFYRKSTAESRVEAIGRIMDRAAR